MVEMFDAASRLAEGRPAVEAFQDYVWACHLLGFQDPDLTLHASQVRDWYGSEDGIDLRALDADCEALSGGGRSGRGGARPTGCPAGIDVGRVARCGCAGVAGFPAPAR